MATGTIPNNFYGEYPFYVDNNPDITKDVRGLYEVARDTYGTGTWNLVLNIGVISSSSALYADIPARPCLITITQISSSTSKRAVITYQSVNSDIVKHRRIYDSITSDWF